MMIPAPTPGQPAAPIRRVFVCSGASCARRDSRLVRLALEQAVKDSGLGPEIQVLRTNGGCLGQCEFGPNVTVHPPGQRYFGVTPEDAAEIAGSLLPNGQPVARLHWSPERFPPVPADRPASVDRIATE